MTSGPNQSDPQHLAGGDEILGRGPLAFDGSTGSISEEPNDPLLEDLLDEVLAPEPPDGDLSRRIVLATRFRLPNRSWWRRLDSPGLRVAAAMVLGVGLGIWLLNLQNSNQTIDNPSTDDTNAALAAQTEAIEQGLIELANAQFPADTLDARIDMLAMQLAVTERSEAFDPQTGDLVELATWSELDQFVDDQEWLF